MQKKTEKQALKLFDLIVYLVIAVCAVALVFVLMTRRTTNDPSEVLEPDHAEDTAEVPEEPEPEEKPKPEPKPELTWSDMPARPLSHGVWTDSNGVTRFFFDGKTMDHAADGTWVLCETSDDGSVTVASHGGEYLLLIGDGVRHIEEPVQGMWLSWDGVVCWYQTAGGTLVRMDVASGETVVIAEGLVDDGFVLSPNGTALVYQTGDGGWLYRNDEIRELPAGFTGISVTDDASLLYGTMTNAENGTTELYAYRPAEEQLTRLGVTKNMDHFTNRTHEELFFTDGKYHYFTQDGSTVYQVGSYFLCEPVGNMRFPVQQGAAVTVYLDSLQDAVWKAVPRNTTLDMKAELYRMTADYQPERFADQVDFYSVQWIDEAKTVFYLKNQVVYRAIMADGYAPKQLASQTENYCVSADGGLLVVQDLRGELFAIHENGALRIDRDVMGGCGIGHDGRTVYYEKAGADEGWQKDLYACRVAEEPVLIAQNMGGLVVEDGYVKYTVYLENATETVVFADAESERFMFRTEREA